MSCAAVGDMISRLHFLWIRFLYGRLDGNGKGIERFGILHVVPVVMSVTAYSFWLHEFSVGHGGMYFRYSLHAGPLRIRIPVYIRTHSCYRINRILISGSDNGWSLTEVLWL